MNSSGGPEIGDLLGMGVAIALCVAAGFGIGWLVDLPLGTFPTFALIGIAVGIAAAVYYVYRMFRAYL